jgi:hypothetical protein
MKKANPQEAAPLRQTPQKHTTPIHHPNNGVVQRHRSGGRIQLPILPPSRSKTIQLSIDDDMPGLVDIDEFAVAIPEPQVVKLFDITGQNMHQIKAAPLSAFPSLPPKPVLPPKPGIFGFIREKAERYGLTDELLYAETCGVNIRLINLVFDMLTPHQLAKLPTSGGKGIWSALETAQLMLGRIGGIAKWLEIAKLAVCDIPGLKMLLTDDSAQGAEKQAMKILSVARMPPKLAGRSYEEIVNILKCLNYVQQETYMDSRGKDTPYGQDVWTSNDHMVIRIKVGGRSLNGKFARPPHAVKEITSTAHQFSDKDIICKMTDDNILIPAGTKFSAKDMQTWYEKVSEKKTKC